MKKKISLLLMENKRILPGLALIGLLVLLLIVKWGYTRHNNSMSEIEAYRDSLNLSSAILARGEDINKLIGLKTKRIKELEKGLLRADSSALAAAELQEAFKKLLVRKNISLDSESVLNSESAGDYTVIPVEFHLKAELWQLTRLLIDLRNSPFLMGVRSMVVKVPYSKSEVKMNISLVIAGAIKNKREKGGRDL